MIKLEYERENKFTVEKNFAWLLSLQNTILLKGNGREMFRLIIAGGRDFADYELLRAFVDFKLSRKWEEIQIVSGGARVVLMRWANDTQQNAAICCGVFLLIGSNTEGRQECEGTKKWHRMRTL